MREFGREHLTFQMREREYSVSKYALGASFFYCISSSTTDEADRFVDEPCAIAHDGQIRILLCIRQNAGAARRESMNRKRVVCCGDSNTWGYYSLNGQRYEDDVR